MSSTEATRKILDMHDQESVTIRRSIGVTWAARTYEAASGELQGVMLNIAQRRRTAGWLGPIMHPAAIFPGFLTFV